MGFEKELIVISSFLIHFLRFAGNVDWKEAAPLTNS
jgi:hypothetical protein